MYSVQEVAEENIRKIYVIPYVKHCIGDIVHSVRWIDVLTQIYKAEKCVNGDGDDDGDGGVDGGGDDGDEDDDGGDDGDDDDDDDDEKEEEADSVDANDVGDDEDDDNVYDDDDDGIYIGQFINWCRHYILYAIPAYMAAAHNLYSLPCDISINTINSFIQP